MSLLCERRYFEGRPLSGAAVFPVTVFDAMELKRLELKGDAVDVSKTGLRLQTDHVLEPGHVIRFGWRLGEEELGAGLVVWSRQVKGSAGCELGIKFL